VTNIVHTKTCLLSRSPPFFTWSYLSLYSFPLLARTGHVICLLFSAWVAFPLEVEDICLLGDDEGAEFCHRGSVVLLQYSSSVGISSPLIISKIRRKIRRGWCQHAFIECGVPSPQVFLYEVRGFPWPPLRPQNSSDGPTPLPLFRWLTIPSPI